MLPDHKGENSWEMSGIASNMITSVQGKFTIMRCTINLCMNSSALMEKFSY